MTTLDLILLLLVVLLALVGIILGWIAFNHAKATTALATATAAVTAIAGKPAPTPPAVTAAGKTN